MICGPLGCKGGEEKEAKPEELVLGNWTQYRNRAYILLILHATGNWDSSVRIADVTSKIVKSKGSATGSWHMADNQLIFTVGETDIESVWKKNDTRIFDIVSLTKDKMELKEESGWVGEWKKNKAQKNKEEVAVTSPVIPLAPVAVNLNKISSASPDRYLCMSMKLKLKELMPGQAPPAFHPKAREAMLLFLSSLIYDDVHNFDRIKVQQQKLTDILNPYMEGFIQEVEIDRVIISSSMDKVETFLIEYGLDQEAIEDKKAQEAAEDKG